jgi:ubiquinone/menaquinone biosynthesis C-methylase UbiE
VLDIGCGEGKFTRALAGLFARASGIDVKEKAIAKATEAAQQAGVTVDFRVASAVSLPYPDASFDTVVFSNSLHHMPDPARALAEAARVLVPGGRLYIMEPVASGNYLEATRLVNDETEVRTAAYHAMRLLPGFTPVTQRMYRTTRSFSGFEEWRAEQFEMDPKRRARFEAQPEEVRRIFEAAADKRDGRLSFEQLSRVNLLKKEAA